MARTGTVFLVGAGPGDAELITVRGRELLRSAQVIVYDRLACSQLLDEAPASCKRIFVGKEPGHHSATQEDINRILVEQAQLGTDVLRLKGGDPFVFGRGGEEILALEAAGIPYRVVPGVTSAVAALASAGIPVTHRRAARSFSVITGHTADGGESFARYARLDGTLVFLMGVAALPRIAAELQAGGMPPDTPVAVVQEGTTLRQKRVTGTLRDIAERADAAGLASPAVIAVGQCAALDFCSTRLPLTGARIAVCGTQEFSHKLAAGLRSATAAAVAEAPVLRTQYLAAGLPEFGGWLFFTSSNGVRAFFALLRQRRVDLRRLSGMQCAAVGTATAETLSEYGIYADFVPSAANAAALAEEFAARYPAPGQVTLLRTPGAAPELPQGLAAHGIACTDIPVYRMEADPAAVRRLAEDLPVLDYLVLTSSAGVDALCAEAAGELHRFTGAWLCLGNKTFAAAQERLPKAARILPCGGFSADAIIRAAVR